MGKVYTHGGSAGDVIYHLAPIKDGGGGELWLNRNAHPHWRMGEDRIASLLTLIRAQPYITDCGVCDEPRGTDLDAWRNNWRQGLNLSDMASAMLGLDHTPRDVPWLTVPEPRRVAPVVFHRSPRYHVQSFPWARVVERYGRDAVFVGDQWEHADFCQRFGSVSYWRTDTYLELAQVIAGAVLFLGNQSSPAAVAQGLRKTMIQETVERDSWAWNCHWERAGMWDHAGELPPVHLVEPRRHSLLTSDRLESLVRTVRECAGLPGELAELGVYRGGSALAACNAAPERVMHLFDFFERGLPEDGGSHEAGEFAADLADVRRLLAGRRVEFHAGHFPATAAGLDDLRFAAVHLDADLYSSTIAGIDFFWPRLVPGGYLVFDDWRWDRCPGVDRAIRERFDPGRVEEAVPHQCRVRKQ